MSSAEPVSDASDAGAKSNTGDTDAVVASSEAAPPPPKRKPSIAERMRIARESRIKNKAISLHSRGRKHNTSAKQTSVMTVRLLRITF